MDEFDLSPDACRSARKLLGISQADLAELASISMYSVRNFETGKNASEYAKHRIVEAFSGEGILFLRGGKTPIMIASTAR